MKSGSCRTLPKFSKAFYGEVLNMNVFIFFYNVLVSNLREGVPSLGALEDSFRLSSKLSPPMMECLRYSLESPFLVILVSFTRKQAVSSVHFLDKEKIGGKGNWEDSAKMHS
jgi:hypothetical protein